MKQFHPKPAFHAEVTKVREVWKKTGENYNQVRMGLVIPNTDYFDCNFIDHSYITWYVIKYGVSFNDKSDKDALLYTLAIYITYLLTPWCRVLLEKLTGLQLVKKFPAFHGTRRFITALTSVRHLSILGLLNPVHIPTSHLLEIRPNIIHPSTTRSPQWSLHRNWPLHSR